MVGSSKILTVSYGTFSCTLEGFDDPFATMRGIAEYFRDLAADDRYFGAEPPTPDAEMLHRIAEREVNRRVTSRVSENGIVLRQADDHRAVPARKDADEELEAAEHAGPGAAAEDSKGDGGDWFAPAAPAAATATGGSVAERLARIRAVVAQTEGEEADEEDDQIYPRDLTEAVTGTGAADTDDTAAGASSVDTEDAGDRPEPDRAAASAAAALADQPADAEGYEEEQAEQTDEPGIDLNAIITSVQSADADSDAGDDDTMAEPEGSAQIAPSDFAALVAAEEVAEAAEAEATQDDTDDGETVTRLLRMRRADFQASAEATSYIEEFAASGQVDVPDADLADDVTEEQAEPEAADDRIADAPEAARNGQGEEESTLSDEDEAELLAELANAEAEFGAEEETADEEPGTRAKADAEDDGADAAEAVPTPEPTVRRLMDVTDTQMRAEDGSRRRSAIAHLKAAVAATRADRQAAIEEGDAPDPDEPADQTEAYRQDLARVVQPRRMGNLARAISRRLPPLMLVSEQRVDLDEADDGAEDDDDRFEAGSVQPRRINSRDIEEDEDENIFSESGSFAEFAREMGAAELPELLEAAAAYYHFVEGQPYFSRPQIMSAVAAMDHGAEFSREDSLKSFGMLLRRGKIRKVSRGQFEIDDGTRFRPQLQAGE